MMSTALSLLLLFMCVMDGNQAFSFTSLSSFGKVKWEGVPFKPARWLPLTLTTSM